MLSNQQFDRTRRLAASLAGIELVERHRELLERRYRRIGVVDDTRLDALLAAAEGGEPNARQRVLCVLTTKFTGFFRHRRHFQLAAEHAVQAAHLRGVTRLWSAATATGEEAYSIALALIEAFGTEEPPAQVLATDIDTEALATAQRGEYGEQSLQALDSQTRSRFFCEARASKRWAIVPAVRQLVQFQTVNLVHGPWPLDGPFDVIFCRNVLMYLRPAHRCAVLERISSLLEPGGLLMLDPTEYLGKAGHLFTPCSAGVYSQALASRFQDQIKTSTAHHRGPRFA